MPGFSLDPDPSRPMLKVTMSGYWDAEILQLYKAERLVAVQRMVEAGIAECDIRMLVDRRCQTVQSQEVTAALAAMLKEVETRAARTAVLVSGALQRLQALRTSSTERTQVFTNEAEALAWLLDGAVA